MSWEALGYIPTPIPLTDTYTAIQTSVVDGEAGGGSYQAWAQFRDMDFWNELEAVEFPIGRGPASR